MKNITSNSKVNHQCLRLIPSKTTYYLRLLDLPFAERQFIQGSCRSPAFSVIFTFFMLTISINLTLIHSVNMSHQKYTATRFCVLFIPLLFELILASSHIVGIANNFFCNHKISCEIECSVYHNTKINFYLQMTTIFAVYIENLDLLQCKYNLLSTSARYLERMDLLIIYTFITIDSKLKISLQRLLHMRKHTSVFIGILE